MSLRVNFLLLTCLLTARAAELKPQALKAWQEYVQSATARMQERLQPGSHFLWIDEDRNRLAMVRTGRVIVSPIGPRNPKEVPSGLIHDWIGAAFIPDATLDDVLSVVRDYGRYTEFYRPSVIDSRAVVAGGTRDRFSMRLLNGSLFSKTALDSDYDSSYFRVEERRCYSLARTTRIQEIENYGEASQRTLPEDVGKGLIWRLFTITRFEEREGGVYIELEVIALSRDIPVSVRWVIQPIVRRVSRSSLLTSLQETENAVRSNTMLSAHSAAGGRSTMPLLER